MDPEKENGSAVASDVGDELSVGGELPGGSLELESLHADAAKTANPIHSAVVAMDNGRVLDGIDGS